MTIYTNHTRHPAIVTIRIDTSDIPETALEIGKIGAYNKLPGDKGVHDYLVDAGHELRTSENTVAVFVNARSAE